MWAAIWTTFAVSNTCGGLVGWEMTYTNANTGAVDFIRTGSTYYASAGGTVDEDWADFSTTYTVTLTLTDATGAGLDSRRALVNTKAPRAGPSARAGA